MKSLAFIPARGGSKRLPGKNIMLFGGLPLLYYSIAFARFNKITKIVVSTDDAEIASVAKSFDAEVIIRPEALSGDLATTSSAAQHCLEQVRQNGFDPDVFVTLQPTNPLRPQNLYLDAIASYSAGACDSVISVSMNRHKFGTLQNGYYEPQNYSLGGRSQDLNPLYFENGLLYLTKPSILNSGDIFGKQIKAIVTPEPFSFVDIDDEFDFKLGEWILHSSKEDFLYLLKA